MQTEMKPISARIPSRLADFVEDQVKAGKTKSDVVVEALTKMMQDSQRLQEINGRLYAETLEAMAEADAEIAAGQLMSGKDLKEQLAKMISEHQ